MAKKPSLAEALGKMGSKHSEESYGDGAAMYVADLEDALGIDSKKAQALYDVLCAIVKSKMHSEGGGGFTLTVG